MCWSKHWRDSVWQSNWWQSWPSRVMILSLHSEWISLSSASMSSLSRSAKMTITLCKPCHCQTMLISIHYIYKRLYQAWYTWVWLNMLHVGYAKHATSLHQILYNHVSSRKTLRVPLQAFLWCSMGTMSYRPELKPVHKAKLFCFSCHMTWCDSCCQPYNL